MRAESCAESGGFDAACAATVTAPPAASSAGKSQPLPGRSIAPTAPPVARTRVSLSGAHLVPSVITALATSATAAAARPICAEARRRSAHSGRSIADSAPCEQPATAITRKPGASKQQKATTAPGTPARSPPSAVASWVDDGPGSACVSAKSEVNDASSIQPSPCTRRSSIIATCAGGPPNATTPSEANSLATSRREPFVVAIFLRRVRRRETASGDKSVRSDAISCTRAARSPKWTENRQASQGCNCLVSWLVCLCTLEFPRSAPSLMLKNRLAARSFARACSNAFRPTLTVPPRKKPTKEQMAFKNREQTIAATNALAAARPDSQEMLLRASVDDAKSLYGANHPRTVYAMGALAGALRENGRLPAAEAVVREAAESSERALGKIHPDTVDALSSLARLLALQGKHDEAEPVALDVVRRREQSQGPAAAPMLDAVLELSHVLSAQGKLDEAEGVVRTALGARREAHGADDEKTRGALRELAALVGSRKKDSRAAVPLLRALHGSRHPHTLSALGSAAQRLHAQGRTSEAEAFARELVNACRDALGGDHPMTRLAGESLARLTDERVPGAPPDSFGAP